jgi:hypothetical protein
MFGNSNIQSSWANPQQNQPQPQQPQQPQTGSVFGQPNAFGSGAGGGGGTRQSTLDTVFLPYLYFTFSTQVLDLVEDLAKIHHSSLSKRTRCSETLPPILILPLQRAARRLVCLFHALLAFFIPTLLYQGQGHLGVVTTIHLCLITQSPPVGLARLEAEGHLPLAQVVERLVRQHHLSRPHRIPACLGSRMRPGARLEPVLLLTSR